MATPIATYALFSMGNPLLDMQVRNGAREELLQKCLH